MPRPKLFALLWTLAILAACTVPGSSLPSTKVWEFDKLVHFAMFAGFGWLWMAALAYPLGRRALVVLGCGVAYAVLTELYQGILPFDRSPDPYDTLANTAGLCVSLLLFYRYTRRAER